eukprot:147187-Prymnesium_polylepis.1
MHQACSLSRIVLTCIVSGVTLTRGGMGAERCVAEGHCLYTHRRPQLLQCLPTLGEVHGPQTPPRMRGRCGAVGGPRISGGKDAREHACEDGKGGWAAGSKTDHKGLALISVRDAFRLGVGHEGVGLAVGLAKAGEVVE